MDATSCAVTPQDLQRVQSSNLHCLTRGESVGLTLLVVTGATSAAAVLLVYLLIIRNVIRESQRRSGKRLIQQPMDIYMLSLLTADLFHAVGTMMNMKWIGEGKSEIGAFCTAQGVINQIGPTAVGLNTLVIAIVTFIAVWWNKGVPTGQRVKFHLYVASAVVTILWIFVAMLVIVPSAHHNKSSGHYWTPTPLWCTIGKNYEFQRFWAKYLWLWLALFASIVLYIPLSFWAHGWITIDTEKWWKFNIHKRRSDADDDGHHARRVFFSMITYPLSNAILTVPLSVVRWVQNTGSKDITSTDSTAVAIVFAFSGLVNVLVLLYIRSNLLLFESDPIYCERCGRSPTSPLGPDHPMVPMDAVEMLPCRDAEAEAYC